MSPSAPAVPPKDTPGHPARGKPTVTHRDSHAPVTNPGVPSLLGHWAITPRATPQPGGGQEGASCWDERASDDLGRQGQETDRIWPAQQDPKASAAHEFFRGSQSADGWWGPGGFALNYSPAPWRAEAAGLRLASEPRHRPAGTSLGPCALPSSPGVQAGVSAHVPSLGLCPEALPPPTPGHTVRAVVPPSPTHCPVQLPTRLPRLQPSYLPCSPVRLPSSLHARVCPGARSCPRAQL